MIPVVAVVGPTASGKTALAIDLAEHLNTEVISADSMQFYRGLELGTGAPTPEELARVPHHFVGHLAPSEESSAGAFEIAASKVVEALNESGRTAVVSGGSGLYVQALVDGLFDGPTKDKFVREQLETEAQESGLEAMYARLKALDSDYAARIESVDLRRIVRALEVHAISGQSISELHAEHRRAEPRFEAVWFAIDWPRDVLYGRINTRVEQMLKEGLVEEVRGLLDAGHASDIQRLRAIGYREIAAYLAGETSLEEAVETMKMHSRRYAKRQLTWYRAEPRINWLQARDEAFHLEQALTILASREHVRA